jgi:TonB-linked SusC/RagA family outer membrane protein
MKQLYLVVSMVLLVQVGAMAQQHELSASSASTKQNSNVKRSTDQALLGVTGKVTDETGAAFPGVNVLIKGTSTAATTGGDGKYSIEADANSVLIFSYVGYATQEVTVGSRSTIDVSLVLDVQALNEVVVTALGISKESKKLGYSATSVKTDELVTNRTTNVMESLEGKVAGLNITPPAAGAGSSNQIRLRGQVGFDGAENGPLLVINGIPMDQGVRPANGNVQNRDRGDNLNNINPDDIESMTVLKGATAAALYGTRAARGAIIITTKSGQKNQSIGVDFTSSYTASQALNFMDEITQTEFGQGQNGQRFTTAAQAQGNGQWGWGARLDDAPTMNYDGVMRPYSAHPYQLYDFLQTGTNATNTVGLSGGGANGSFRASVSTTDSKGITPQNEYKRKIFNLGLNHNITKKLKFILNMNYSDEDYINPPQIGTQGDGAVNFFNRMPISTPLEAYRDNAKDPVNGAEWKTNGNLGTMNNPYYPMQNGQRYKDDRNRLLGTGTLRYEFTKWLYAKGTFSYDRGNVFTESIALNGTGANTLLNTDNLTYRGNWNTDERVNTDINADFLVGANKEFGKFSVDASFGGNTWRTSFHNTSLQSASFTVANLYSLANGTVKTPGFGYNQTRINSLYGLAEIGYNGLVFVNVTGRNDWFSVLNPQYNSKFYPSVSGSFILSEVLPEQTWLSYAKLRASWAQVGSIASIGPYEGRLSYNINQNAFNGQTLASVGGNNAAPNPLLQPFTVTEKEVGMEMRLFKNRVVLDVAAFDKVTTEQVLDVILSNTSGYSTSKQNQASLKNSGLETLIELKAIQSGDFTWTTSWNNSFLKTKVLDVGTPTGTRLLLYFNGTGNEFLGEIRYTEGLAMNQLYTRSYLRDGNGNILVTPTGNLIATDNRAGGGAELTNGFLPQGSSIPKFTGGWNNTFTYKNLSLGLHIDYKFGGTVLSSTHLNMARQGLSKLSLEGRREGETGLVFPGVYATGPNAGQPNTSVVTNLQGFYTDYRNLQIGDPFVFKSDFIKLRNISLTYNLTSIVQKVPAFNFVRGLSLSGSVRNVAILYKDLPGLDPEAIQSSGDTRAGYENSSLPTTRNYNLTLNVKF